jgi:uncharacterized protein (TIGR02270 family)
MSARGSTAARFIPGIVEQHVEEAASLHSVRSALVRGAWVRLRQWGEFDHRLAAHLQGLRVAGCVAVPMCQRALEMPGRGAQFVATLRALESGDAAWLRDLMAVAQALETARSEFVAVFGWLDISQWHGVAMDYLNSTVAFARAVATAAFGLHRLESGLVFPRRFADPVPMVRARAWRTAGEIGKRELVSTAASVCIHDSDPFCRFWAAWSAVLLGDRHGGLDVMMAAAARIGPERSRAFQLALQASTVQSAHNWLAGLNKDPANRRWLIRGAGLIGDPKYIPWLIEQMTELKTTRLAGESFSLITGLDLAWLDLEVKPPENFESGPNDDPNDPNVEMDEDDGLPWPDVVKIKNWWQANAHNFKSGTRYFMGQPLNRDNCLRVLKEGFQRQRIAAAYYLSLLNPGTPLFEWRAPAWRQQRLLAQMT